MTEISVHDRLRAEAEVVVQFCDLDPLNVVWHGNYANYLEVVRSALFDQIGYNYPEMQASGYAWPIIDLQLRYIGPARFGQRLKLSAEIMEWEHRLKIRYQIQDAETGRRLTRATTVQVAVDLKSGEMCFVSPQILLDRLGVKK